MPELIFKVDTPIDVIEKRFENASIFDGLMESLQQAIAFKNGDKSKATVRKLSLPDPDSKEVRTKLQLTQKAFAELLGVSQRTVEAWESGKNKPTPIARKLINAIDHMPELINVI